MLRAGSKEKLDGGRIKGSMIRSRFDWLKEMHPEIDRKAIVDSLPEATRAKLTRGILASEWYDFADLIAVDRAFHERFGGDHPEILKDFGRFSAKANVTSMVNAMTLHEFFRNSVKLHDRFQDFGEAAYEQTGDKGGKMIFRKYPCYSPIFCDLRRKYPWTLDTANRSAPAVQDREDHLNVIEQVDVRGQLEPGEWVVEVVGRNVPASTPQKYALVFSPTTIPSVPSLSIQSAEFDDARSDGSDGNGNGYLEGGETVVETFVLRSADGPPLTNVIGSLRSLTPGVVVLTGEASFSDLPAGGMATNLVPFSYRVDKGVACGTPAVFELVATAHGHRFTNSFHSRSSFSAVA